MRSTSSSGDEEGEERAAGFVLFRTTDQGERQYLLLRHRSDGQWGFPKGKLEPGEDEFEAAVREIREETGIEQFDLLSGFLEMSCYAFQRKGRRISKTVVYFLGETSKIDVSLSTEHTSFHWLAYEDAAAKLTYDEGRRVLNAADQYVVRTADAESRAVSDDCLRTK
jgi:bis(5'-nucleosidyl)-tetraphosphatase